MAWYHQAAVQGHIDAQFELGELCREEVPLHEEAAVEWYRAALKWYRQAAWQGHVRAQFVLGVMYASGCGDRIPQDTDEAVTWFHEAADRGHFGARLTLGQMYSRGEGVPRDLVVAHMWFTVAARPGPAAGPVPYERALAAKQAIEYDMTSSQIEEATRRAQAYAGVTPEA